MDILHPAACLPPALGPAGGPRRTYKLKTDPVLSPQYELTAERQLTLDGRAEPTRRREPPEPVLPVVDDRTGELFAGAGGSRSKTGLDNECDNAATFGSDPDCGAPPGTLISEKHRLIDRLSTYLDSLPVLSDEWDRTRHVLKRLRGCGTAVPPNARRISFRAGPTGRAHVSGVLYCGRWLCPTCASFIQQRRREALAERAAHVASLGPAFLFTMTLRHHAGVKYAVLVKTEAAMWKALVQHRTWKDAVVAFERADEVTYGRNGFHCHKHTLVTLKPTVDADAFREWVRESCEEKARELGRTCDWSHSDEWWSPIAPERLEATSNYLQKLGAGEAGTTGAGLIAVAAGEVLGQSAKRGSEPWRMPPAAFVEAWHGSRHQRTFALGGEWRTPKTVAVEADEDAAAQREEKKPAFADVDPSDFRTKRWRQKARLNGRFADEAARPEWVPELRAVFGDELRVLCAPGETPPTPPDGPCEGEGGGGDAPFAEAQGSAVDGTAAVVAPQPQNEGHRTAAPRKPQEKAMNEHKPKTYTLNAEETAVYDSGDDKAVLSLCVSLDERFGTADSDLTVLHPDGYVVRVYEPDQPKTNSD